ncbi:MAG: hypothetical protein ACOC1F_13360, partial [Myxococcota bacterium]
MKWRTFASAVVASLIVGFAAGGCGSDDGNAGETSNTPEYKPDPNADPKLEFVANQSQTLKFGDAVDLAVRYVDQNSSNGIANAPIDYAIVDDPGGSQLGAIRATTDANGNAGVSLTAGQQNATFQVEVAPPSGGGEPIAFQIVVSDQPVGSIAVSMSYLGDLTLEHLVPSLHQGVTCDTLDYENLPTPLMTTNPALDDIDDTTSFVALSVANDYAVTVTGNVGPNVRAFGCVDGVEVLQSQQTDVKVALADVEWPGPVLGTYDLVNQLDFGGTLPDSVQTAVDILDEFSDDQDINGNPATEDWGQDPGAFLTDLVMRQTCAWECDPTETYDTCSVLNHPYGDISAIYQQNFPDWDYCKPRTAGACGAWDMFDGHIKLQELLNGYIEQYVPAGVLAFTEMAGDIARAINKAKIYSELNVQEGSDTAQPMTHRLVEMEVLLHDLDGNEHVKKFDLADAGLTSLQTNASLSVDVDYVTIPEHEFALHYGKLVQYIYLHELLPVIGYSSTADMLGTWIECAAVGQFLADNIGYFDPIDYENYCNTAIDLAGEAFDSSIAGFIDSEGTLKLQGTCTATDIDPITNIAATLSDGKWIGQWGEDAGGAGNVSGTFTGTLRQ